MVVLAVERERLVVKSQTYGSHTYIVLRLCKAHSQGVVALTSTHTAYKVHQCRVGKIVGHSTVEIECTLGWEPSAHCHCVAIELGFHKVTAYRNRNTVFALCVGLYKLSVF